MKVSCRKTPGGSHMPHFRAAHCPVVSWGTGLNGHHGQCFLSISWDPGCMLSPRLRQKVVNPVSHSSQQRCCSPPCWAFPRVHAPDLSTISSEKEVYLALNTPYEVRQGGRGDTLDLAQVTPQLWPQSPGACSTGLMVGHRQHRAGLERSPQALGMARPDR